VKYEEFRTQEAFAQADLLAFAHGSLVEDAPEAFLARLPTPPMLMIDRIVSLRRSGHKGSIVAERDVRLDDWFFQCHFIGDPVQPGCLGLDGIWQLLGFYCAWNGGLGAGRALGCGEVEFYGQIRPRDRCVRTEIEVRRYAELPTAGATLVIGDATVSVDGEAVYSIKRAKVGTFRDIDYPNYPHLTARARGGKIER
jgi:3-hydroxyacyl-[acyl-carrier protein] dehydratase/trans-2-decenoyl-[acyl-carrier protein] isomerase